MATKVNLVVDQGADFTTTITLTNDDGSTFDLTDYSAASQIRKHYTSSNATNMSVTLNGNSGIVTLTMNNSVTAATHCTSVPTLVSQEAPTGTAAMMVVVAD